MLPQNNPDRIRVVFDDHRLVANAGLLLPATLAQHLGLRELVGHHLDLGCAPGRANTGDKLLTLVASALAGGDFIDDADALRAGGTVGVLGCVVKAPSTLGTFLRSFRWGHVRQLDRVSRQLLARAWGLLPSELVALRAALPHDHACPSHTLVCRSPCHLPTSWDGNPAAAHRPAARVQRHVRPCLFVATRSNSDLLPLPSTASTPDTNWLELVDAVGSLGGSNRVTGGDRSGTSLRAHN